MIARTVSIIAANWWFYLFFAVLLLILAGLSDAGIVKSGNGVINTVLWLMFARFVHRAALFNVKFAEANPDGTADRSYGGFMLKGLALLAVSLIVSFPVLLWTMGSKVTASAAPDLSDVYPFLIALLVIYALVLSLAGSWLPASVYKRNSGLGTALKRGSSTFFNVLAWIAPTLLLTIIVEFAALFAFTLFDFNLSIVSNGVINPTGGLALLVVILIESFSVSLISVVLSHYYLAAEGIDNRAKPAS